MKTCTCPHEATRNGFMRTGYDSLCPFHGAASVPVVRPEPLRRYCGACGTPTDSNGLCLRITCDRVP